MSALTSLFDAGIQYTFSFLDRRDLESVGCVCQSFNFLSSSSWEGVTVSRFGDTVAMGSKTSNRTWQQTYNELESSQIHRMRNVPSINLVLGVKAQTNKTHYSMDRIRSAVFGHPLPNPNDHYYPEQAGSMGNQKVVVFKKMG